MKTQTTAKLRQLRMSPRKVRFVVDSVRGLSVAAALNQLDFSKKNAAGPVAKLLRSAVANAIHNHDIKEDSLVIKTICVDEGSTLHRWTPRAFGRASRINKRASHITVVLEGDAPEQKKKKSDEETEKESVITAENEDGKNESVKTTSKKVNEKKQIMPKVTVNKQAIAKKRGNK